MEVLIAYLKNNVKVTDTIEQRLNSIFIKKTIEKGEHILTEHSLKKQHVFVVNGCLRSFYRLENGKEVTIQFAIENWWIGDYITIYTDNKSVLSIEALTQSEILVVEKDQLNELYQEYPEFEAFQRKKIEKHLATLQKRILSLLTLTGREKYNQFIIDYADFVQKIPNYQIASYLGITPESLSRIRKTNKK